MQNFESCIQISCLLDFENFPIFCNTYLLSVGIKNVVVLLHIAKLDRCK
jgi:hypothetical protein